MQTERGYQRTYLRAPHREEILYVENEFVFKAATINISEGGLLLEEVGHFPESDLIPFMLRLKQYPYLKNYTLDKLESYSQGTYGASVIRFKASLVRKIALNTAVDKVLASRIGLKIQEISPFDKARVSNYVDVFASNLIYLQVLIDTLHADKNNLKKVRIIAKILGYSGIKKMSQLRKTVEHDYKSLQWL
jgi:hypothetical protein